MRRVGSRSPSSSISTRSPEEIATRWAWPLPSIQRPRSRLRRAAREDLAQVADGVRGDAGAGALGAELAQDAGDRGERRTVQRVRPVGRHDRVEHERFDVARVGLGVALGDLRAVGGPVQDELFVPAGLADRLDVGDGFGGRVRAACGSELARRTRRAPARARPGSAPLRSGGRRAGGRVRCRAGRRRSGRVSRQSARAVVRTSSANGSAGCPGPPASAITARALIADRRPVAAEREGELRRASPARGQAAPSGARRRIRCCLRRAAPVDRSLCGARCERTAATAPMQRRQQAAREGPDGPSHRFESSARARRAGAGAVCAA